MTEVRFGQVANANWPIVTTELPRLTLRREVQREKEDEPINVTESGMVTDVKLLQHQKPLIILIPSANCNTLSDEHLSKRP